MSKPITVRTFARRKAAGERISMLTAYDYASALLVDQAGVDAILVGDSLGNLVQGQATTLPVTLDEMIYHTRMVARAAQRALVILDLPFASYRISREETLRNACRVMQESGAGAVKIEGGVSRAETIRCIVEAGVPVLGHVGLMPTHVHETGLQLQGRDRRTMERVLADAAAVEAAGCFAMVLENVPASLAAVVTRRAGVPTIGIGAGPHCDGQVLVFHDLLGLGPTTPPPFVRQYAELGRAVLDAVRRYHDDVLAGAFPGPRETRDLDEDGLATLADVAEHGQERR